MEAERLFAKTYPAVHAWFQPMRQALIDRYDQGHYYWELRSCDYWREFEVPKVIYPDIYEHQSFAWDTDGFYSGNTTYFIPIRQKWLVALLNSGSIEWFYSQISNRVRGGYLRAFSDYMQHVPIPPAEPAQRLWCERLAEALIWLHGPATARKASNAPVASMRAYFEQWLNGLVCELFFPDELHSRQLMLFAETARLNPPDLSTIPDPQKLARLRELFEQAYDSQATLRSMLFSLRSLEVVRIIEEPLERSTDTEQDREL
jgi:hypothetical protein